MLHGNNSSIRIINDKLASAFALASFALGETIKPVVFSGLRVRLLDRQRNVFTVDGLKVYHQQEKALGIKACRVIVD